jgi:hypothetical protein
MFTSGLQAKDIKVFWIFSSEKNFFLPSARHQQGLPPKIIALAYTLFDRAQH